MAKMGAGIRRLASRCCRHDKPVLIATAMNPGCGAMRRPGALRPACRRWHRRPRPNRGEWQSRAKPRIGRRAEPSRSSLPSRRAVRAARQEARSQGQASAGDAGTTHEPSVTCAYRQPLLRQQGISIRGPKRRGATVPLSRAGERSRSARLSRLKRVESAGHAGCGRNRPAADARGGGRRGRRLSRRRGRGEEVKKTAGGAPKSPRLSRTLTSSPPSEKRKTIAPPRHRLAGQTSTIENARRKTRAKGCDGSCQRRVDGDRLA